MNGLHFLAGATLAMALATALPAAAQQQQTVYQYKDAKGVTHYTDLPPQAAHKRREIDVRTGTSAQPVAQADTSAESEACRNARGNVARLQGNEAVGIDSNGDGKPDRNLTADERKAQLELNQAGVKAYCGASTP